MVTPNNTTAFLAHHGIKGQKWGVRRFQNSDGSLTSKGRKRYNDQLIKKGTDLYRVSDADEKNLHDGFYASIDQKDRNKYLNTYAKQMLNNGRKVIEKTLSANNDIKIPTHKKSIELMNESLDKSNIRTDVKQLNALKKYFSNDISDENNASDKLYRKAIKELDDYANTGKVGESLYDAINVAQADRRSPIVQDISSNFYNTLNKYGYGAIVDLNDYKYGSMKTNNPLIITNAGNVSISQIRQIEHTGITGNFLAHHGIKGQKWGVQNGPPYPLDKRNAIDIANNIYNTLDKFDYGCIIDGKKFNENNLDEVDWSKYRTTPVKDLDKTKIGVCWDFTNYQHNRLKEAGIDHKTHMLVMDIDDGVVTHTFTTFKDPKSNQEYWLEQALYSERGIHPIKSYKDVVDKVSNRYDPSKKRQYDVYEFNPDGMDQGLTDQEFFDRATNNDPVYQRSSIEHSELTRHGIKGGDTMYDIDNFLAHHGILGQKWGIRRYQNEDGSLTKAGKKHYEKLDAKWAKKNTDKITKQTQKKVKKDLKAFNKELAKSPNYLNASGQVSKATINAYNRKMASLMNTAVGDIESPSGRIVRFVAKRGEVGVQMALTGRGYNMDQLKNGVWSGGRVAYRSNQLNKINI